MKKYYWKTDRWTVIAALSFLMATALLTYSPMSTWIYQYNQTAILTGYHAAAVQQRNPSAVEQLEAANEYNKKLVSGATYHANANNAEGSAESNRQRYNELLAVGPEAMMGRVKVPSVNIDLPIFHGTAEETLLKGVGHLEGTSLPVGGLSTRSVLTAHRGLASAKLFTDLVKVKKGDEIIVEVLDQALVYQIERIEVIDPEDTYKILPEENRDLLTLITCTPLGINSQRVIVTGSRVIPTPAVHENNIGGPTDIGFPWWLVIQASAVTFTLGGLFLAGLHKKKDAQAPMTA
ncbi:Sortase (surface protein transpeptidase) [Arcanobacterium haemolyticum]|uniref:class C sortase n=1 Tax=Arcanobacterium haemolyticum TaxID=28264 RepID=UPI000D8131E5|nr:class C sortase [Arcanobacterium haemolyticum]SPT74712.1 Sortase (surface protein transpeptidase) [Arcanobacterium haemolyticum]